MGMATEGGAVMLKDTAWSSAFILLVVLALAFGV
jgi:hypothetical protein